MKSNKQIFDIFQLLERNRDGLFDLYITYVMEGSWDKVLIFDWLYDQ